MVAYHTTFEHTLYCYVFGKGVGCEMFYNGFTYKCFIIKIFTNSSLGVPKKY